MAPVIENFFTPGDFAQREKEVLKKVLGKTGFVVKRELFRGVIFDTHKLGSVILLGTWQSKPAVLKLQGLKIGVDEVEMFRQFSRQNKNPRVRVPRLYAHEPWEPERGYGYHIMEYIDAAPILKMPWPSKAELTRFAQFYEEYRTSIRKPWVAKPSGDVVAFGTERLERWRTIRESKEGNDPKEYAGQLEHFTRLAKKAYRAIELVFCHGHLTANDVYPVGEQFVLMSNIYWTWRPPLYDAVFAIWGCLIRMDGSTDTADNAFELIGDWLNHYRQHSPHFAATPNLERMFWIALLERLMGVLLADLALHDKFKTPDGQVRRANLLKINQELFEKIAKQVERAL
ncbi:MAG: hypothetical protein U0517_01025 [Candidatus Andersenbacteria bacterium]